MKMCSVDGCNKKHHAKGFCSNHYHIYKRQEKRQQGLIKDFWNKNEYVFHKEYVELIINVKDNTIKSLIDLDDYKNVSNHQWCVDSRGYVKTTINGKEVKLHRFINNPNNHEVVDHINHNTLDNRKQNLRNVSMQENSMNRKRGINNTSGYKNISKNKNGTYTVSIQCKGIRHRKTCLTLEQAIELRDKMLKELHGEFACKE